MVSCGGGHIYCTECVKTSTKVAIGEGKTKMECFSLYNEDISWQELLRALKPKLLSQVDSEKASTRG